VTFARGLACRIGFRTTNVVAALALAAAPALLRAQSAEPDRLARLDVGSSYAITLLIDSANTEGLPGRMLRLKAYEGIAKKADGRQIVAAVRRELIALRVARAQLGDVDDDELAAAAAVVETEATSRRSPLGRA
jgi:hypothetical protein